MQSQGYPPPSSPTTPTATPAPDSEGYFPPPTNLDTTTVTISTSQVADLLAPVQEGLDDDGLDWLSDQVVGDTLSFYPIWCSGGACDPAAITLADLPELIAQALVTSNPVIQGYFIEAVENEDVESYVCAHVITGSYGSTVDYPTAQPSTIGIAGGNPSTVTLDAADFEVCDYNGLWTWNRWLFGGYHEIIDNHIAYGATSYFVVRP